MVSPSDQCAEAVCHVWDRLACRAVEEGVDGLLVLFGDDVQYVSQFPYDAPPQCDWLRDAWRRLPLEKLGCVQPIDVSDVCAFPIVSAAHVKIFGRLLPPAFINQGGDPFLWSIYQRVNAVVILESIYVHNARGGPSSWPGYEERAAPKVCQTRGAVYDCELRS